MDMSTFDALERAARAGDVSAMTQVGALLLSGDAGTFLPQQGADWLLAAAERGGGEACERVAVLAAAGVCRPQSWDTALGFLQQSAEAGWEPAQKTLLLLAAECAKDSPDTPRDWHSARQTIDIAALTASAPKQSLSESPRIRKIEGFASAALCRWVCSSARSRLARARTYDASTGAAVVQQSRTNSEADFNIVQADVVLTLLRARIATVTGLPPAVMELTKVLHYTAGQQFAPHFDFIDPRAPGLAEEMETRGQRLVTFLLYLNDDYEGGETDFPKIGLRHKGRRGDALMFANVDPAGQVDRDTLHAGLAPISGEKWLLSQWIRDRVPVQRSSEPRA